MANHFIISPTDIKIEITEGEEESYEGQIENLKYARGHFIEILVEIENKIDAIIESLIIRPNKGIRDVFRKKVLNSRILNTRSKVNLLYELIKIKNCSIDLAKFSKSLDFLVSERNKWAHGLIYFERKKINKKLILQANLLYYNSKDEQANYEIHDRDVKEINGKLNIISEVLNGLVNDLKIGLHFYRVY